MGIKEVAQGIALDVLEGSTPVDNELKQDSLLHIGNNWYRVSDFTLDDKGRYNFTMTAVAKAKTSKGPFRIVHRKFGNEWLPEIINEKERTVAVIMGKDSETRDQDAMKIVELWNEANILSPL